MYLSSNIFRNFLQAQSSSPPSVLKDDVCIINQSVSILYRAKYRRRDRERMVRCERCALALYTLREVFSRFHRDPAHSSCVSIVPFPAYNCISYSIICVFLSSFGIFTFQRSVQPRSPAQAWKFGEKTDDSVHRDSYLQLLLCSDCFRADFAEYPSLLGSW